METENHDKLDLIFESLERIEARLKKLECYCKENENNLDIVKLALDKDFIANAQKAKVCCDSAYIKEFQTLFFQKDLKIPIPNKSQGFNFQVGWSWNIGNHMVDPDRDGIKGKKDHCPNTNIDFLRVKCPELKKPFSQIPL